MAGNRLNNSFENICVFHILDGLRDGLSHFSDPSRAALIYTTGQDAPPRIYDPQDLLRGHEPRLQEFFFSALDWRGAPVEGGEIHFLEDELYKALELAGIISFGGRSNEVPFQLWFTEEHPDMCNVGPTRCWLEYAVRLFAQNFDIRNVTNIDTAGYLLQNCAIHAVRDFIVDERSRMGWLDTRIRVYPFLDAVLGISRTKEEGAWPRGRLVVVEPSQLGAVPFICTFPPHERPLQCDFKHVRKVLQAVEYSGRVLVSDGERIVGIALGRMPGAYLAAQFSGTHGFLMLRDQLVCTFSDGSFHSSNRKANLVQLEELLLESTMPIEDHHTMMRVVTSLVNRVRDRRHGCTLIIDLGHMMVPTAGQHFDEPLDLRDPAHIKLASSLAKLDGALHIGADLKLHGFACLMDGRSVPGENRGRGARFNSALRFTSENEDLIVIVVSSDRPVSIIKNGIELTAACDFAQIKGCPTPPLLSDWVVG
ncbi:DNA integrity scanning protein DisA nucleotide-binding domain protein [Salidesulfovibrio onnuriiensis]|uniref:DNA integrity scanning protein DisA nucleotide-binding domain protein n=1 Tax=Salidesulfovibrio onnuriiensis TaxID=2583823 RepID=UPI0011CCCF78|nr:DNA integrity scanning protein DisA nucleotide-binding domain protein [Salidesulfovibrio onnuriiensis]